MNTRNGLKNDCEKKNNQKAVSFNYNEQTSVVDFEACEYNM